MAQPTIQALIQSEMLGGNCPVLIAVIKKLISPVMKVERTKVEITVATVNVKVLFLFIWIENTPTLLEALIVDEYLRKTHLKLGNESPK